MAKQKINPKTIPLSSVAVRYICPNEEEEVEICKANIVWWTFYDAIEAGEPVCYCCGTNMLRCDPDTNESDAVILS